jgi:hypothetical protein
MKRKIRSKIKKQKNERFLSSFSFLLCIDTFSSFRLVQRSERKQEKKGTDKKERDKRKRAAEKRKKEEKDKGRVSGKETR